MIAKSWNNRCSTKVALTSRSGFTLSEVVIAAVIMAVFFTALLGFFAFARRSGSLTENRLASTHIARQALEDLRRLNYEELPVGNNKKPLPRQPKARGYYNVVENTADMTKDITVVVEWVEPWGLKQSVSLTTTHSNSLHQ